MITRIINSIYLSIITFVFLLYLMIKYNQTSYWIIPFFIIPLSITKRKNYELEFMSLSMLFFVSLALPKFYNSGNSIYIQNFLSFLSVFLFTIIKKHIENKYHKKLQENEFKITEIKKSIEDKKAKIEQYKNYKNILNSTINSRTKLLTILKNIQNCKNNDETIEEFIRGINYLFPQSKTELIVTPSLSPMIEDVFRTKTALFIPSTKKDNRYSKMYYKDDEKSIIILPLIVFSNVISVIKIYSSKESYFNTNDFRTLDLLSTTASVSIENISLYLTTEELARKDPLSSLFTHRVFQDKVDEEILVSARTKKPFTLIIADIDHFKKVNDTYGHQAGDEVIKKIADTIKLNIREFDFVARYGGEEFAIILPQTPKIEALKIAQNIVKNIKSLVFNFGNKKVSITISMGISEFPVEALSKSQLIRVSDERLYKAKKEGRDRIIYE